MNKNRKIHSLLSNGSTLFYIIFVLWFTTEFIFGISIDQFSWGTNRVYLRLMSIVKYMLVFYILFFQKNDIKTWLIIAAVSVLLFVCARNGVFYDVFYVWLFIVAAKGKEIDRIIRITAVLSAVYVCVTICLSLMGVLDNIVINRGERIVRYSLGFAHPNSIGFRLFVLTTCILYLCKDNVPNWLLVVLLAINIISLVVLNSRTSFICILLVVLVIYMKKYYDRLSVITQKAILTVMFCISLMSIIMILLLTFMYRNEGVMRFLNKVLSQRLLYGNNAYNEWGLTMLGQQIFIHKSERLTVGLPGEIIVDCAYVYICLRAGITTLLLYVTGYIYSMVCHIKKIDYLKCSILVIMAIYGVMERMMYMPMWNVFVILLTNIFPEKRNDKTIFSHAADTLKIGSLVRN